LAFQCNAAISMSAAAFTWIQAEFSVLIRPHFLEARLTKLPSASGHGRFACGYLNSRWSAWNCTPSGLAFTAVYEWPTIQTKVPVAIPKSPF